MAAAGSTVLAMAVKSSERPTARATSDILDLVTIGTELLLGFTVDTNSGFLGRALAEAGIWIARRTSVRDDSDEIRACDRRIRSEVGAEAHTLDSLDVDKLLEQRPPGVQRHVAQVVAGEIGQAGR